MPKSFLPRHLTHKHAKIERSIGMLPLDRSFYGFGTYNLQIVEARPAALHRTGRNRDRR